MTKEKVLIICSNFWPEPTGISVYSTDLATFLKQRGFEVSVLTGLPHYPWWKIPNEYINIADGESQHEIVRVIRVKHFIPPKINVLLRAQYEFSLWWNLRRVSNRLVTKEYDVVISFIPTVAAGLIGERIAKKLGVPFGLIVQDLSGAGAKQSGVRGGALISLFANKIETSVIKAADSTVVVSAAMREALLKLKLPSSKVLQIPNYSAKRIRGIDHELARKRFGWSRDEFSVVHAGNMGAKQDLENVIEASKTLIGNSKIRIYLVGHGNQEARLKKMCEGLRNIALMPAVPDNLFSTLLSAADLLLVNERSSQIEMSLPSKLTSYLFSGRPVLAAVPRRGATWKFLDGIAELVDAGNPSLLANAIKGLSQDTDKRNVLASKGLEFARNNLGAENGRRKYLDWVNSLVQSKRG